MKPAGDACGKYASRGLSDASYTFSTGQLRWRRTMAALAWSEIGRSPRSKASSSSIDWVRAGGGAGERRPGSDPCVHGSVHLSVHVFTTSRQARPSIDVMLRPQGTLSHSSLHQHPPGFDHSIPLGRPVVVKRVCMGSNTPAVSGTALPGLHRNTSVLAAPSNLLCAVFGTATAGRAMGLGRAEAAASAAAAAARRGSEIVEHLRQPRPPLLASEIGLGRPARVASLAIGNHRVVAVPQTAATPGAGLWQSPLLSVYHRLRPPLRRHAQTSVRRPCRPLRFHRP